MGNQEATLGYKVTCGSCGATGFVAAENVDFDNLKRFCGFCKKLEPFVPDRREINTKEEKLKSPNKTHDAISFLKEVADTSSTEYAAHAQLMSFKKRAMELIAKQHHA